MVDTNGIRAQILDESAKLFIEHGINGTSINDIAQAMGVTRTKIYYYFKDKNEILAELTGDVFVTGRRISRTASETRSNPEASLRSLVEIFVRVVLSNPVRYRVIERNEIYLPEAMRSKAAMAKKKVFDDFRKVIAEGIRKGVFRATNPSRAALAIIGMCSWSAWWYRPEPHRSIDETVQFFVDFAMAALNPSGGRARSRTNARNVLANVRDELALLEKLMS